MLIVFYYLNSKILIPKQLAVKKILQYIVTVLLCFFLYLSVMYGIMITSEETKAFEQSAAAKSINYKGPYFFSGGIVTLFLIAFLVSTGIKVITQWFSAEEIKEEISKQQLQTELSLLKTQVNPHFLFNTLNSIYSLAIANNQKTADAVLRLSRIMRYTLEDCQENFVALQQEIDFINSYIELQKLRLTNNNAVCFTATGNISSVRVAPFVFIPFIENAFKYGTSTHRPSSIKAMVNVNPQSITFTCENHFQANGKSKAEGTGTGINNAKRRLELIYYKKHDLKITTEEHLYKVSLTINLN
jgi:LytS/YehU family sensor histidine kinase